MRLKILFSIPNPNDHFTLQQALEKALKDQNVLYRKVEESTQENEPIGKGDISVALEIISAALLSMTTLVSVLHFVVDLYPQYEITIQTDYGPVKITGQDADEIVEKARELKTKLMNKENMEIVLQPSSTE